MSVNKGLRNCGTYLFLMSANIGLRNCGTVRGCPTSGKKVSQLEKHDPIILLSFVTRNTTVLEILPIKSTDEPGGLHKISLYVVSIVSNQTPLGSMGADADRARRIFGVVMRQSTPSQWILIDDGIYPIFLDKNILGTSGTDYPSTGLRNCYREREHWVFCQIQPVCGWQQWVSNIYTHASCQNGRNRMQT